MLDKLRKAGQAIADFDNRYAKRAAEDMGGVRKNPIGVMLGGTPMNEMSLDKADTLLEKVIGNAALGAVGATNIGYRYALPAAGVTLAGKGLIDTAALLGQQTSSTLDPE